MGVIMGGATASQGARVEPVKNNLGRSPLTRLPCGSGF